jgi:hypothetical protein
MIRHQTRLDAHNLLVRPQASKPSLGIAYLCAQKLAATPSNSGRTLSSFQETSEIFDHAIIPAVIY